MEDSDRMKMDWAIAEVSDSEMDRGEVPSDTIWHCCVCDWSGLVQDCHTEVEPIGFAEGPCVDMPYCPECGEAVDF